MSRYFRNLAGWWHELIPVEKIAVMLAEELGNSEAARRIAVGLLRYLVFGYIEGSGGSVSPCAARDVLGT